MGFGRLSAGRISQEAIDCFLALLRDTDTMRNEIEAGPRIIPLRGMNKSILLPAELLASIETPVYFLWGAEDPLGGEEVAHDFVKQIPNAQLEIMPGAGHASGWTIPFMRARPSPNGWVSQGHKAGRWQRGWDSPYRRG